MSGDMDRYAAALAQLIAHETGHLLGYEHQDSAERGQGLLDQYAADAPVLVDHQATDITQIPESAITAAKANLHIAYGHTSHGSQLITGMEGLVSFANNDGLGLNLPDNIFSFNAGVRAVLWICGIRLSAAPSIWAIRTSLRGRRQPGTI